MEQRPHRVSPAEHAVDDDLLRGIVERIVDAFHPRRIVLFGSRARGEDTSSSDIDLFVEMESDKRPPRRAAEVAALFGLRPWSLDVIVYTPEEAARLRKRRGSFLRQIEAEGRVLFEDALH